MQSFITYLRDHMSHCYICINTKVPNIYTNIVQSCKPNE